MIVNILIGWSVLTTIVILVMIVNNGERQAQIDKIEMNIESNKVFDIIVEDVATHYHPSYYHDYQQRVVTIKEAVVCLYRKLNFRLSYTPEKTETISEDVSIK